MADTKISAGADPGTVVATDKVPMARSASTTAYAATVAEIAAFANGAYAPNYAVANPVMDGTAAPGVANTVSRGDHVHPTNTALLNRSGGTMTGTLVLAADPAAPLQAATKQYVDGSAPAGGPYVSIANMHDVGRNLIHNPLMAVAQRGAGPFTTAGTFSLDRWMIYPVGSTQSVTQQAMSDAGRTAIGDEGARFFLNSVVTGTAGASDQSLIRQSIEDVRRTSGKTVTLSFYAQASAGTPKLGIALTQAFGTGGSPSAVITGIGAQNVTLSTAWTRYSVTIAVPSAAGKTLGTAGDDRLAVDFCQSAGATSGAALGSPGVQSYTLQLWGVQLEIGSTATPLDYGGSPQQQLANCQRFFQSGGPVWFGGYVTAGLSLGGPVVFPVPMRATPTVALSGITYANTSGASTVYPGPNGVSIYAAGVAAAGANFVLSYTASADL